MEKSDNQGVVTQVSSLGQNAKHLGKTREEQVEKNQEAIELIRSWREEKLELEELKEAQNTWDLVKQFVDENRLRKLFE